MRRRAIKRREMQELVFPLDRFLQMVTFLPKVLWKQFRRLSNWCLLLAFVLECIRLPKFSAPQSWSALAPLLLSEFLSLFLFLSCSFSLRFTPPLQQTRAEKDLFPRFWECSIRGFDFVRSCFGATAP